MQISEPAEYVILGLLKRKAMHGYELYQQFEHGTVGQIVHLEMSQMYAFLKKLERMEYIQPELEAQGTRPPRKIFHLLESGEKVFMDWLAQPVDKPRDIRILFLVKLYFVRDYLPHKTAALIEQQIAACQRFLVHLENQQDTGDGSFFAAVVLRSRIHQTNALLEWLRELQQEYAVALNL